MKSGLGLPLYARVGVSGQNAAAWGANEGIANRDAEAFKAGFIPDGSCRRLLRTSLLRRASLPAGRADLRVGRAGSNHAALVYRCREGQRAGWHGGKRERGSPSFSIRSSPRPRPSTRFSTVPGWSSCSARIGSRASISCSGRPASARAPSCDRPGRREGATGWRG